MNDRNSERRPWQGTWDPAWNGGGSCEWCGSADGFPCEADCPDLLSLVKDNRWQRVLDQNEDEWRSLYIGEWRT